jgi:hypothetical protein
MSTPSSVSATSKKNGRNERTIRYSEVSPQTTPENISMLSKSGSKFSKMRRDCENLIPRETAMSWEVWSKLSLRILAQRYLLRQDRLLGLPREDLQWPTQQKLCWPLSVSRVKLNPSIQRHFLHTPHQRNESSRRLDEHHPSHNPHIKHPRHSMRIRRHHSSTMLHR